MKLRWKKTFILCGLEILVIIFGVYFLIFHTFGISEKLTKMEDTYTLDDERLKFTYYEKNGNQLISIGEDSWVEIVLPEERIVESIEVFVSAADNLGENIKAFYTSGEEYDGSLYKEVKMQQGSVKISFADTNTSIKKIRLDLTEGKNIAVVIKKIHIRFSSYDKWNYNSSVILFSIISIILTIGIVNKEYFAIKINHHERLRRKYHVIEQICSLAIGDFKSRFSGSYLGVFWGIIQPFSTILLFWFVFQVGFRSQPIENVPFILWLSAGMIPWNYFYDSWFGGTNSFTGYNYIVKKVVFDVRVLPVVKALSSALLNAIFNLILLVIYCIYSEFPGIHILDMIYFSICIFMYTLGLSYITATLNVFIKDIGQFLGIILQFIMWMTPMMWQYTMIPDKYSWFYKLNPLHYIINGYRESLIYGYWFFHHKMQMIWFWTVTLIVVFSGYKLMNKLKIHFADVL